MVASASFQTLENRRAPRDVVSFRTLMRGPAGLRVQALIVDISPLGLRSRTNAAFAEGDRIAVSLPVVAPRDAIVRWVMAGRIGVEFDVPLPAHLYARMLAAMPHDPPRWDGC